MNKTPPTAFTLIELLVVVAIVGILAGIVTLNMFSSTASARDATREGELSQIKTALLSYHSSQKTYPQTSEGGVSLEEDSDTNGTFTQTMVGGGYMSIIPRDPSYEDPDTDYSYKYFSDSSDSFTLCAKSESEGGYICTTDNSTIAYTSQALVFGEWGGGGEEPPLFTLELVEGFDEFTAGNPQTAYFKLTNNTDEILAEEVYFYIYYDGVCGSGPFDGEGIQIYYRPTPTSEWMTSPDNDPYNPAEWDEGTVSFSGLSMALGETYPELRMESVAALCPGTYEFIFSVKGEGLGREEMYQINLISGVGQSVILE